MWDKVGISREAHTLNEALGELDALEAALDDVGAGPAACVQPDLHDWLNLKPDHDLEDDHACGDRPRGLQGRAFSRGLS